MSTQLNRSTLEFLSELKENNYREWFQENKPRYTEAIENFRQLVAELIVGINEFDKGIGYLEPSECLFRIYRDVRFSANKDPYKTNLGAYIAPGGKKSPFAGYYFHVEPGASFISGGIYMAPPGIMKKIREDIGDYEDDFLAIVNAEGFKKNFSFFDSEKLKKLPRGFESGSKVDEYLKMKHITTFRAMADDSLLKPNIVEYSLGLYKDMKLLIDFINRAIR